MPHLDVFTYHAQIFWLLVSLFLLYIFIEFFFVSNIRNILQKRCDSIESNLQQAEKLVVQHQDIRNKIAEINVNAKNQSSAFIAQMRSKADNMLSQKTKEIDSELIKKLENESTKLDDLRKRVSNNITEYVPEIAKEVFDNIYQFYQLDRKKMH